MVLTISVQMSFLSQKQYLPHFEAIAIKVSKTLKESSSKHLHAIERIIAVDLAYTCLRYAPWTKAPGFTELLVDFLHSDFGLDKSLCLSLSEQCVSYIAQYQNFDSDIDNLDFFEELVAQLIATDSEKFYLGFGSGLRALIEHALDKRKQTKGVFHNEIISEILTALNRIEQKIHDNPQFKPLFALRTQLLLQPLSIGQQPVGFERLTVLFDLLVNVYLGQVEINDQVRSGDCARLAQSNLLFYEKISQKKSKLALTNQALKMISATIAGKIIAEETPLEQLTRHSSFVQESYIACCPKDKIKQMLSSDSILRELAASAFSTLLNRSSDLDIDIDHIAPLLQHTFFDSIKTAILCKGLAHFQSNQDIKDYLELQARQGVSPKLRQAARLSLRFHGDKEATQ